MKKIIKVDYSIKNLNKLYAKRLSKEDYDGCISALKKCIQMGYNTFDVYEKLAKTYYKVGMYEEAVNYWFLYLSICPKNNKIYAYNGLGACFYKLNQKTIAGIYFTEQLKIDKSAILEYNEIGAKVFDEITDYKSNFYLAYPYNKADFTELFNQVSLMIKAGLYLEAIDELEVIPKDSKYYFDALMQKSICKYFVGNIKGSLKDIDDAVKLQPNNTVALCNAISLFNGTNNTEKVNEFLNLLLKTDNYANDENIVKTIMIFCELKCYEKAEFFAKNYLRKNPYDLIILFLYGITKYNLNKFDDAINVFSKCYRINESYINLYYLKLAEKAKIEYSNGKEIKSLVYTFDVQDTEKTKITKKVNKLISKESLTNNDLDEVINLFLYAVDAKHFELQSSIITILAKTNLNKLFDFIKSMLLNINVYDRIKSGIVSLIVSEGFVGEIDAVFANTLKRLKFNEALFVKDGCKVFTEAYSVCVGRIVALEEDFTCITDVANELYTLIKDTKYLENIIDVKSLGAVIFEYSKIKTIKNRREFAKFFNANLKTIKEYKQIFENLKLYNQLKNDYLDVLEEVSISNDNNKKV